MAYILWYNNDTMETQYWFMRGPGEAVVEGDIVLVPAPDPNDQFIIDLRETAKDEFEDDIFVGLPFSIVGTNGQQIVWHHSISNETQIWTMVGSEIVRRDTVHDEFDSPIFVGPPFRIVGACSKFSTSGNPHIVWYNDKTFETQIWIMNENTFSDVPGGIKISKRRTVHDEFNNPIFVGPPFHIIGMANFHGDPSLHDVGDIVWHNDLTNETQIWVMQDDGFTIARRQTVLDENRQNIFVGLPFHIVGVATPGR